jgi:hypothetical protein
VAFRILVGALHIAQPVARSWGRLKTSGVPAPEKAEASWTGDRIGWLKQLRDQLGDRGLRVAIAEPHEHWDLSVRSGLFVKTRLGVAVTWGWTPVWAMSHRPRATSLVIIFATAICAAIGGWSVPIPPAMGIMSAAMEVYLNRRVITQTMIATTRDARP